MSFLVRHRAALALLALALLLALAFQGSRALWEPDEGRYTNVALQILSTGDPISLHRHRDSLHFTKPPLTYWTIAASVATLGYHEWAVRLPLALAFVLSAALLLALGRWVAPRRPWLPALIYVTSPVPLLAAYHVNTDTLLAAMETLAVLCYVRARFAGGSLRWLDGMWLALGLAFLTKGPPGLLPLLVIVVFQAWCGGPRLWRWRGLLAFAVAGLGWYIVVILRHPGLLDYFLGHELLARVASDTHRRFPEWYGPFVVYGPTLLLGALPWGAAWLTAWRDEHARWRSGNALGRFLWLWLLLPLAVFCLARSRLPLYLLPLFAPLSLLIGRALQDASWTRPRVVAIGLWVALLIALKAGLAAHPTERDSRAFAGELQALLPWRPDEVVFVEDLARYGLSLYLRAEVEKVSFKPWPRRLSDNEFDNDLASELAEVEPRRVFVLQDEYVRYFHDSLRAASRQARLLGRIGHRQVFVLESDLNAAPEGVRSH